MTAALIAFGSNPGKYKFEGETALVNCFAEKRGIDSKAPLSVLPHDGIIEFIDVGATPCRGMIYLEDLDVLYSVHSSSCFKITYDGTVATALRIGTVPGTGLVELSRNQSPTPQIVIQGEYGLQIIESDTISYVTDESLVDGVITADYVGGYHVYGYADRTFFISELNNARVIDGLDFATFEQRAGKLLRVKENNGELIGFCSSWMEFWRDVGAAEFPFNPIGYRSRGILAAMSVATCNGQIVFVGNDGIVYKLNNYDPARISSHSVERLIEKDTAQADISAFAHTRAGHHFAFFKGTGWDRCYDASTTLWCTRESYGRPNWRGRQSVQAWGKTLVGDSISGKLGYLDPETYTEYGGPMVWGVDSPPMHVFPNGGIVDALHMDIATGYGTLSGQGSDPKLMLQVSKDGGSTWGSYRELELGRTGKNEVRVTARRLGKFGPKGVMFRMRISDPVARALVATDVEVRPLKR